MKFKIQHYIHLKISSLSYHIDDLVSLITNCKTKPKVVGISESRMRTGRPSPLSNINTDNYVYEYTPTESSKGGTLLYIDKLLKYKLRKDLSLNKPKEIELTFIEIIETKKKNTVIGCIYKQPKVPIKEFLSDYLQPLLINLSFENKEFILMGDFNINLLNCNTDKDSSDYVDTPYSHSFYSTINSLTRITPTTKTLIDNIFYNNASQLTGVQPHKAKEKRSFHNFDPKAFEKDLENIDWKKIL